MESTSGMDAPFGLAARAAEARPSLPATASMSEPARSLKLDIAALALFAGVVFFGLALTTYHPADPISDTTGSNTAGPLSFVYQPDVAVYPQHDEITNACGRLGAVLADAAYTGLGWGAWYLLLSLAGLDALLLIRKPIDTPAIRLAGWFLTLVAACTLLTMFFAGAGPGPVIGGGGYLGALAAAGLASYFALVGGVILTVAVLAAGVLLLSDYVLLSAGAAMLRSLGETVSGGAMFVLTRGQRALPNIPYGRGRRNEDADDALAGDGADEEEDAEEDDETPVSIRIHGRDAEEMDWSDDEEEEADEEFAVDEDEEYDEEAEPAPVAGGLFAGLRRRLGSVGLAANGTTTSAMEEDDEDDAAPMTLAEELDEAAESELDDYELPALDILLERGEVRHDVQMKDARRKAKILEKTFTDFGFNVRVVGIETGPVIGMYEVELEAGLRLSKITGLADDIAIALRVPSVRIVAPIPGKNTVGIEIPNKERQIVRLREIMEELDGRGSKMKIPLFLGRDVSGGPLVADLASLPHLLIAGRTGTGKSVCLNAIISSILMTKRPDEVRMLMIDPKMVELSGYKTLPHLMHPVVTDMKRAEAILAWAVEKMEQRYELLAKAGVRHVTSYNELSEKELLRRIQPDEDEALSIPRNLPFIVIVADEMADLMMTAGKDVEQHIIRLAQKSRAVGIHLILATQKPTVDVITGLIKSNLPARIAFQVASRTDSRVVLDEMGADKLLGNGDMLFLWPGTSTLLRGQGTYLSDDEINAVVEQCSTGEQHFVPELVNMKVEDEQETAQPAGLRKRDDLYEAAVEVVVREGRGSVSLIQRALAIGYGRAARMIDWMAEDGIVGEYNGSNARDVTISVSDWEAMQAAEDGEEEAADKPAPVVRPKAAVVEAPAETAPDYASRKRRPAPAAKPAVVIEDEADEDWDDEEEDEAVGRSERSEGPADDAADRRTASLRMDDAEDHAPAKRRPRQFARIVPPRDENNEIDEDISDAVAPRPSIFDEESIEEEEWEEESTDEGTAEYEGETGDEYEEFEEGDEDAEAEYEEYDEEEAADEETWDDAEEWEDEKTTV
jgi:S-DNA-T family DNA segregation ATPase FtsK/SpoIIIE